MVSDFLLGDSLCFMNDNGEWKELKGTLHMHSDIESKYCDISLDDTSHEMSFKMKKKDWYKFQKALGLIKPKYRKMRKGKRYIWYEII